MWKELMHLRCDCMWCMYSKQDLRDYMVAINAASATAVDGDATVKAAAKPMVGAAANAVWKKFELLMRLYGVGKGKVRVTRVTATMLAAAEAQIPVTIDMAFKVECGHASQPIIGAMLVEPYTGTTLDRLYAVERAFFKFFATGKLDMFYEPGLYSWVVCHVSVAISNRVHTLLGMRAGLVKLVPEYEEVFRQLSFGDSGANSLAAALGDAETRAALAADLEGEAFPEALAWLMGSDDILPFAIRGSCSMSELKTVYDSGGAHLGVHTVALEQLGLLCRSPSMCLFVHAAWFGMFVSGHRTALRNLWQRSATEETLHLRLQTPLWPCFYANEYTSGFQRTCPLHTWNARRARGPRAGTMRLFLGGKTLLNLIRRPFLQAGYLEAVIWLRSFRRMALRSLQVDDILLGGTGAAGLDAAAKHCAWAARSEGGIQVNGSRHYADGDQEDLGVPLARTFWQAEGRRLHVSHGALIGARRLFDGDSEAERRKSAPVSHLVVAQLTSEHGPSVLELVGAW